MSDHKILDALDRCCMSADARMRDVSPPDMLWLLSTYLEASFPGLVSEFCKTEYGYYSHDFDKGSVFLSFPGGCVAFHRTKAGGRTTATLTLPEERYGRTLEVKTRDKRWPPDHLVSSAVVSLAEVVRSAFEETDGTDLDADDPLSSEFFAWAIPVRDGLMLPG